MSSVALACGAHRGMASRSGETGADFLLQLLCAVEENDLQMHEFLGAFRESLLASRHIFPLAGWGVLKRLAGSLEIIFQGCSDPAKMIAIEARNADLITEHFNLMRCILSDFRLHQSMRA